MTKIRKRIKRQNRYDDGLKRKIAKEYLSGVASYAVLAEEHGLKNKNVVKEFVKWYRRKLAQEKPLSSKMPKQPIKIEKTIEDSAVSCAKIAELEKQLHLSKLKIELLETMIDQAEQDLSIDIRKKSGTNQ